METVRRQSHPATFPGRTSDETDTSPYHDPQIRGISTAAYSRNMSVLTRALDATAPKAATASR